MISVEFGLIDIFRAIKNEHKLQHKKVITGFSVEMAMWYASVTV